ncbi:hypothetical protein TRFO_24448 [Tritrichomonas foetus]|uniref:Reticulon domain-containing protein n=1 Tax=Tritrichomonas foetus TaxID=1144522 RepID=A0A1J4KCE9_9EUKA|nr:hypothetical protein TRFO_24448 [Tritrichomonas foetus]|eukprot:OHT07364.1 hypothetical protein TRFO_24448 [Tritrichomonas foetus]
MCECECSKCPFKAHATPEFLGHLQEIIYWRRPIPSLVVLLLTNFFFFVIYKLNTGCVATAILLCALHGGLKVVMDKFGDKINGFLFSPPLEKDSENRTDRIRSVEEVTAFVKTYHNYVKFAIDWLNDYLKHQTIKSHVIFFGSAFAAFFVTTLFGTWGLCFVLTNAFLTVPALLLNTELHAFINEKMNKPKTD